MTIAKTVGLFIGLGVGVFAGHALVNMIMGPSNPRRSKNTF